MLTIRGAQWEPFRQARLDRLAARLFAVLRERKSAAAERLDDAKLRARIEAVLAWCCTIDLDEDEPASVAVMLGFELHPRWADHPGARAVLADRGASQRTRMQGLVRWYESAAWLDTPTLLDAASEGKR
jgi:hypothetical protein